MSGNEQNSTPIKNQNIERLRSLQYPCPAEVTTKEVGYPCMIIMVYRTLIGSFEAEHFVQSRLTYLSIL